jgi:hypothetical protein
MRLFHKFIHKVSTIFLTYKVFVELVCDDFDICKVQGEYPLDCNLLCIILYSFLFMSFSHGVSYIKVLMRQYQYKDICHIFYFFHGGF